jgi:hypothetical protein
MPGISMPDSRTNLSGLQVISSKMKSTSLSESGESTLKIANRKEGMQKHVD